MRVLILSQYYKPEPIPKPVELAEELRRRGHDVTVVTGFPNYPTGILYEGFRLGPLKREVINGVPVIRTYEYPYHGKRTFGRLVNYASFMFSAPVGSLMAPRPDVIYVWHPPLTVGLAAWVISCLKGIPFVYDVQDIWPEAAVLSGILKPGLLVRCMSCVERFVYSRAAHVLVVTQGAKENLISKGVETEKISVMPHWVEESLFERTNAKARLQVREHYGWGDRFVVMFAGNLGLVQGLRTVVSAVSELRNHRRISMVLVGEGSDKRHLQEFARSLGVEDRIQFIGYQPMERMPEIMAASDVLLVHLKHSELSRYVIPTKTLAYLAAARPILMAMDGAAAQLVRDAGAGLVIPPENPSEMANAIRALGEMPEPERDAMGRRGRDYLVANLSKKNIIHRYEETLQRVAHRNGDRS